MRGAALFHGTGSPNEGGLHQKSRYQSLLLFVGLVGARSIATQKGCVGHELFPSAEELIRVDVHLVTR